MILQDLIIPEKIKFNFRSVSILILMFLVTVSCKKLVDVDTNNYQSPVETAAGCQGILDNYEVMNTGYPSDGEASADDYFLTDAGYLQTRLTATDRDLYIWSAKAIRAKANPQWQSSYNVVYNANMVLDALEKLKGTTSQSVLDGLRGQALFFRAYAFWQIAQVYAKPYVAASSTQDLGIPLYLSAEQSGNPARSSVQNTYSQIIKDLQESSLLLSAPLYAASRPNKASAYAMLARTYLSMENYPLALENATTALALKSQLITYSTLNVNSNTPFARYNAEVIFHSLMTPGVSLDPGSATNNTAKIDAALVSSYAANDLRGRIFLKANSGTDAGTYRFTGNYEPSIGANFFNGLAVDEIYLIRAESYARAGNTTAAMADLNTLLRTRWSGSYTNMIATSANDALNKILVERRKELLMRGLRWSDLRRLNTDTRFTKTLNRSVAGVKYTLLPNDLRYILFIPDEVIINSSGAIQQNIR